MSEISQFSQGLHEECGVFGIYDKTGATDMVSAIYSALYALQHRGQESCGIALNVDGVLSGHRDLGLVSEVFTKRVLEDLPRGAKMATGHVRYATAGQRSRSNAQPMILHHCKGAMAVCHNGNLVNAPKLRQQAGDERFHLPRYLGYRGHRLPADPEPPADPQHRDGRQPHHGRH